MEWNFGRYRKKVNWSRASRIRKCYSENTVRSRQLNKFKLSRKFEAEAKWLLDRNKYLEKTFEQCRKKKWKKITNLVDYGYFKPRDMTQVQKTGGIIEELNQEKVTVDVKSLEGVERKRSYAEMLPKVVTNTVGTSWKPKNIDKNKIMEPVESKANYSLCRDNKIEGGKNIHFAIENKWSDWKKNKFTPETEQKVEGKVFGSQHINGSRESNCNVNLNINVNVNVLSANDIDLVNIRANLGETSLISMKFAVIWVIPN